MVCSALLKHMLCYEEHKLQQYTQNKVLSGVLLFAHLLYTDYPKPSAHV